MNVRSSLTATIMVALCLVAFTAQAQLGLVGGGFSVLLESKETKHDLGFPARINIVALSTETGRPLGSAHGGVVPIITQHVDFDLLFSIDNVNWRDKAGDFGDVALVPVTASAGYVARYHRLEPALTDDKWENDKKQPTSFRARFKAGELMPGSYYLKFRLNLGKSSRILYVFPKRGGQTGYVTFALSVANMVEPEDDFDAMMQLQGFNRLMDEQTARDGQSRRSNDRKDDHNASQRRGAYDRRSGEGDQGGRADSDKTDADRSYERRDSDRVPVQPDQPHRSDGNSNMETITSGAPPQGRHDLDGLIVRAVWLGTDTPVSVGGMVVVHATRSRPAYDASAKPFTNTDRPSQEQVGRIVENDGFGALSTFAPDCGESYFSFSRGDELYLTVWGALKNSDGSWNRWGIPNLYHVHSDGTVEQLLPDGSRRTMPREKRGIILTLTARKVRG